MGDEARRRTVVSSGSVVLFWILPGMIDDDEAGSQSWVQPARVSDEG